MVRTVVTVVRHLRARPRVFLPAARAGLGRALGHREHSGWAAVRSSSRSCVRNFPLVVGRGDPLGPVLKAGTSTASGSWWRLVVAFLAAAGAPGAASARSGRFRAYAIVMGADGVVRIVGGAAVGTGVTHVGPKFAMRCRRCPRSTSPPGAARKPPVAEWRGPPNLGWLLIGSVSPGCSTPAVIPGWLAKPADRQHVTGSARGAARPPSRCSCSGGAGRTAAVQPTGRRRQPHRTRAGLPACSLVAVVHHRHARGAAAVVALRLSRRRTQSTIMIRLRQRLYMVAGVGGA